MLDTPGARALLERELGNLPLAVRVMARLLHLRTGSKPDDAVLCGALASPQPGKRGLSGRTRVRGVLVPLVTS